MRLVPVAAAAALFLTTFASSMHAAEPGAVVATARQRIEATDARATGHLVHVDASGQRVSNGFSIKAHWFPGVLRVLLEITPSKSPTAAPASADQDARASILLEMRPGGQSTIRVFHPRETAPATLPFSRWSENIFGSDFNYEDFLQPEFYWKDQSIVKSAKFGSRDCDVLKSTPSASDHTHYLDVQTWIDKTINYPVYVEKTLKEAGTIKEFTSLGLSKPGGVWEAKEVEVKVHGRPGSTLLMFERGSTKANLTLKDFSPAQIGKFEDHP